MARNEGWLEPALNEVEDFVTRMHNRGVSIMELARLFTRLDEDEPIDDEDLRAKVAEELLA